MMIDIYTHILPAAFFEGMSRIAPRLENIGKRMRAVTLLHDLDARFRLMDGFEDYRQIISLPNPPIETFAEGATGAELARIGNDAMAELVAKHPDRFPTFVAALALDDLDTAMVELHRAIDELGACGIQIFTNVKGEPLDQERYLPLFDAMAQYDLPIWLHPARTADMTDYTAEAKSRFEMWWCFGWPYETSVAMARLVFFGLFDRHPGIKIVTHHLGGMIPYFEGRVGPGLDVLGARTSDEDYSQILPSLKRPHAEYFPMFYADTAMFGAHRALPLGLDFFGDRHVVFSTDCPFAPVAETIAALDRLELEDTPRKRVFAENTCELIGRSLD